MNQETIDKIHNTKKKNGSYGKSKEEDRLFEELNNIFDTNDVCRQYKDDRYPFRCDFYIKSLDLFIEYNGYWVHNTHFYNCDSDGDQQIYIDWLNKLNEGHKAYENAIRVWTVTDPLKLQTAINNNINYVVLWTPDDIDNFLDKIKDIISVQQLCEDFQCF